MSCVSENLNLVKQKIEYAAKRAGRKSSEISLVAVSKTKPVEQIREAFDAGQMIFGENYVQEAVAKVKAFLALPRQPEWHLIGSLQTNKVRELGSSFALIHSVDREKLLFEIEKFAEKENRIQEVLLQVHIGDEASKQGAAFADLPLLIESALSCRHIRLRGLMSLPPLSEDESIARGYFSSLRAEFEKSKGMLSRDSAMVFDILSMGTSGDFEWAILEGATMVRVGTAIFGSRES